MVKLTLSANAGGAIQLGNHRILVDALHEGKLPGFSTLDQHRRREILDHPDFCFPEMICLTHDHPDHHSPDLLAKAKKLWPDAKFCRPEDGSQFVSGDLSLAYIPTPHDGVEYKNTPHHAILIQWQGKHILISGDCAVADAVLLKAVDGIAIDLAILNFPWITLKKGRACLTDNLKPKHCVLWHLPFAQDDVNGFRRSTEAALTQYPAHLLYDHLQTIELDI